MDLTPSHLLTLFTLSPRYLVLPRYYSPLILHHFLIVDRLVYSRTFPFPLPLPLPFPSSSLNTQPPPSFFTITSPLSHIFLFVIIHSAPFVTKLHCHSLNSPSKTWKHFSRTCEFLPLQVGHWAVIWRLIGCLLLVIETHHFIINRRYLLLTCALNIGWGPQ